MRKKHETLRNIMFIILTYFISSILTTILIFTGPVITVLEKAGMEWSGLFYALTISLIISVVYFLKYQGKEIRNKTLGITAIEVAIAAGLAIGSVIHGKNFVQDIISAVPNVNIVDILALTVGIAGSIATAEESFLNMQKLSRIHTDLNVSKKMIEKFEEKENNGRTR